MMYSDILQRYRHHMPSPSKRHKQDSDDLSRYVFATATDRKASKNARHEVASAVSVSSALLPREKICEVRNEHNAILLEDIVVIHRDCGFLRQCTVRGWKTLYSAAYTAESGNLEGIEVRVCTYNYWLVGSFVCGCMFLAVLLLKTFEEMFRAVVKTKKEDQKEDADNNEPPAWT
jgi:hypothetical protein